MCPPEIKYLWADYFWLFIGKKMNSLHYFNDIIIEQRHYSTGKRKKDKISCEVDNRGKSDFEGYNKNYLTNNAKHDIEKLSKSWNQ